MNKSEEIEPYNGPRFTSALAPKIVSRPEPEPEPAAYQMPMQQQSPQLPAAHGPVYYPPAPYPGSYPSAAPQPYYPQPYAQPAQRPVPASQPSATFSRPASPIRQEWRSHEDDEDSLIKGISKPHHTRAWAVWDKMTNKWSRKRKILSVAAACTSLVVGIPQASSNVRAAESSWAASQVNLVNYKINLYEYNHNKPKPLHSTVKFQEYTPDGQPIANATTSGLMIYTIDPNHVFEHPETKTISIGVDITPNKDNPITNKIAPPDENSQKAYDKFRGMTWSYPYYVGTFHNDEMEAECINDLDKLANAAIAAANYLTSTDATKEVLANAESVYPIEYYGAHDDPAKYNVVIGRVTSDAKGAPNEPITNCLYTKKVVKKTP